VVIMIAVGGLTRLTDSGLSITEWAPLSGAVPPLSAEDWEAEFAAYREIPEYQLQNRGMSLAEFKVIYWWEWGHRQLGRFIGLVWALGSSGFWRSARCRGAGPGGGLLLGALGGAQGAIGWWMVSSGLAPGMLDVASYRLAIHLGPCLPDPGADRVVRDEAWPGRGGADGGAAGGRPQAQGDGHGCSAPELPADPDRCAGRGHRCGRNFPDWPLMAGGFLPPNMWVLEPVVAEPLRE
jgi:cytochrome c oxidase assembly protein subunit 15